MIARLKRAINRTTTNLPLKSTLNDYYNDVANFFVMNTQVWKKIKKVS